MAVCAVFGSELVIYLIEARYRRLKPGRKSRIAIDSRLRIIREVTRSLRKARNSREARVVHRHSLKMIAELVSSEVCDTIRAPVIDETVKLAHRNVLSSDPDTARSGKDGKHRQTMEEHRSFLR